MDSACRKVRDLTVSGRAALEALLGRSLQDDEEVSVQAFSMRRRSGRKVSECFELAKAYEAKLGYAPTPDPDFAKDVQLAIDAHDQPWNPPSWDEKGRMHDDG